MSKISFKNDYSEGAHPAILSALSETNLVPQEGYGYDAYCEEARAMIRRECDLPEADIYFVSGGTQTNLLVISHLLRPHEAVIAAASGHINVHETGAIESTGHKVCTVPTPLGKLTTDDILAVLTHHTDEHMVKPAMVYISQSTEFGTLYSRRELSELSAFCRAHGLLLYLDGARIGSAVTASGEDNPSLREIAALVDAFYIGGTKNGALLGEAIVFTSRRPDNAFLFQIKQRGAMLAKGRILGIQFATLFRNGLFYELATHANRMAAELSAGIAACSYSFLYPSQTNQIFPILPNSLIEKLSTEYDFYVWQSISPDSSAIRLVTSWATPPENVAAIIHSISSYRH
ncbi:threonine aldolase family protein [Porphyromonas loveana]|uniref:threonine aldolase family protein n=1 Tax=Porphyromonas loveana TaxID=1884669 RepID=UPI00359FF143